LVGLPELVPPARIPLYDDIWNPVLAAALVYWQRVSNHPYVSDDFRTIARGNVIKLKNTR